MSELIIINKGDEVKSDTLNFNFQCLDEKVISTNQRIETVSASIKSVQSTLNSQLTGATDELNQSMEKFETETNAKLDEKLNANEKQAIILWGIPDYKKGKSVGTSFTASSNGVYTATVNCNNSTAYFNINGVNAYCYVDGDGVNGAVNTPFTVPLAKGDVCSWSANVQVKFARFFPMRGAE